jgi:hypothetical protein
MKAIHSQSALIKNTLLTLLYRNKQEELERNYPKVLTLLSYSMVGMQQGMECVKTISKEHMRIRLLVDDNMTKHYQASSLAEITSIDDVVWTEEWAESIQTYSYIFIPILSFSLVSKILNFDDCHPFSRIIFEALFQGKKVGAVTTGADPYQHVWQESGYNRMSPFLKAEMRSQLHKLRGYGIELLDAEQITGWFQRGNEKLRSRPVITREKIEEANHQHQNHILISSNAIVTPLADDLAKQYGIEILKR